MDLNIFNTPTASLPLTMTRQPNAVVVCQAAQFRRNIAEFAPQLARSAERIDAEIAVARQAGHQYMVYRVAEPRHDVPPSLVLGTIDPDGSGILVLRPETVPDFGEGWCTFAPLVIESMSRSVTALKSRAGEPLHVALSLTLASLTALDAGDWTSARQGKPIQLFNT